MSFILRRMVSFLLKHWILNMVFIGLESTIQLVILYMKLRLLRWTLIS